MRRFAVVAFLATLVLAGCASSTHRAPVEERAGGTRGNVPASSASASAENKQPPGAENAGKPGYYSVKPGDTLIRIGLETGQNWRDIARWNNIDNPNVIEVGQVVRVAPPNTDPSVASSRSVAPSRVESRPLDAPKIASAPNGNASAPVVASVAPSVAAVPPAANTAAPASPAPRDTADDDIVWTWPANGPVATPFDDARTKGLAITGKAGDPVLAAADGRVVYAGSGLRGYGNLVIVKHNNTYLTAYAHNQALLVKEEQVVRRGQKIAEMGSSDAERVELHFEIRKQGKPIDPAKLLPPR